MRIEKDDAVLVVVDIQERLFPHIHDNEQLERNCTVLISGMKVLDVPVIVSEQYSKGLGPTIPSIRDTLGDIRPVEKMSFSCCGEPTFITALNKIARNKIIVCGTEAHVCVLQTALDLHQRGFIPVVIEDCISSRKPNDKIQAVERMRQTGMIISTYESILFELCQVAGTEQFKAISKLVK